MRDVTPAMLTAGADLVAPNELQRALRIVSENARVLASVEALREGDMQRLGETMVASHASLRDDYEVSSRERRVSSSVTALPPACPAALS